MGVYTIEDHQMDQYYIGKTPQIQWNSAKIPKHASFEMDAPNAGKTIDKKTIDVGHKRRLLKNFFLVVVAAALVIIPNNSLMGLQSSLNSEGGLGVATVSCQWASNAICSLLIAPSIVNILGQKRALFGAWSLFCLFIVANAFPSWYTLMPASFLMGLGFSIHMVGLPTFVTPLAKEYAEVVGDQNPQAMADSFNGISFAIINSGRIWGEMISSAILLVEDNDQMNTSENQTVISRRTCGADFCPNSNENVTKADRPSDENIYILMGTFFGMVMIALILLMCMDETRNRTNITAKDVKDRVVKVLRLQTSPKMIPLILIFFYAGFRNSLMWGDFNQAYVSCELGIGYVGLTMVCMGITNTISAYLFGVLQRWVHRSVFVALASIFNLAAMVTMLLWTPSTDELWLFFTLPAIYGVALAVWQTQQVSLIGTIFPDNLDIGFVSRNIWNAIGMSSAFAINGFLCVKTKAYITIGVLCASAISYIILELLMTFKWKIEAKK
ncbi:unnamed protein product [Owenia fusiformis]|uniref:Uncharacterized protein n=1 Tax=Owenia fusiformis TaxID=6347 RepID=A0A8J1UHI4_OWEFU|nr:unnamed protein product [Owenia fusiformis]